MRKDIDLNFRAHPLTGDVVVKKDVNAIQQSLINLVRTAFYERGFNVSFGTGVYSAIFDNIGPATTVTLEKDIAQSIQNHEPGADLRSVGVMATEDGTLRVVIMYHFNNNPEPTELSMNLKRVR